MIKELMHDPIFLAQKSETADRNDIQTAMTCVTRWKPTGSGAWAWLPI